ncbi:sugar ABC transporter ATP-binding protein [Tropicimonas sp. IMCC34043]|uniref:sugar ABC transporter ATP-binding protein n=1 Tax=Tropicimonas sp. IMCC34043 TaxID=2248760 RepID=UPI0018E4FA7D|nr:sugar ABC transporter ATP-binding protein [Tropicimonas sp. IMCC34043]
MTLSPDASFAARALTRRFPGVVAVDAVDLTVARGEIHGLIGKNGAGKSVLVSMVAGLLTPSEGRIDTAHGALTADQSGPARALKLGIALVSQEPQFAEDLSVEDNLFMGRHPTARFQFTSAAETRRRTAAVIERLRLKARPDSRMGDLSVETQQLLAFGRAVFVDDASTILLDEITASLTSDRKEELLQLLKALIVERPELSFTLISHHVSEVMGFSDRVSVMRDGRRVATLNTAETTARELADWIVGDVSPTSITHATGPRPSGTPLLRVRELSSGKTLHRLSLDLHRGEVIGFAGLEGSGKDTAVEALYGLRPGYGGQIEIDGAPQVLTSPKAAQMVGISFLPKNREAQAVIQNRSVLENAVIAGLPALSNRMGFVGRGACETATAEIIAQLKIKTPSPHAMIDGLSGGNKQKVLLGRMSLTAPRLILLNEPTRGVDISAKPDILKLIREDLSRDAGVIMISESEEELTEICDRILVFYRGEVVRVLDRGAPGFDVDTIYKSVQGVETTA